MSVSRHEFAEISGANKWGRSKNAFDFVFTLTPNIRVARLLDAVSDKKSFFNRLLISEKRR